MEGVELLLHNLSHSDLVLDISNDILQTKPNSVIARPKFSKFKSISEDILINLNKINVNLSYHSLTENSKQNEKVAIGFDLLDKPVIIEEISSLRFRQDDCSKLTGSEKDKANHSAVIRSVYFPLISILIPKWLKNIDSSRNGFKKVVVLVSGRGTPFDESANMSDNSTESTGRLIELFLKHLYPDVEVKLLHSTTNLFRYDHNIIFVKQELLPLMDSYRDQLVESLEGKWKENMRVSLSFADGSSARISAINASLRHYRPSYMHFWQLKSFWRELKICEDDIEHHSYEEICTEPAIAMTNYPHDPLVTLVLEEMTSFRNHFMEVLKCGDQKNDLGTFWLRKTKKPVLAVLLVQKGDQQPKLYRGTNMEVSMPTGSLCAERNVIGSALADDITLCRKDLKIIAVYSATIPSSDGARSRGGSLLPEGGACSSNAVVSSPCSKGAAGDRDALCDIIAPRSPNVGAKRKIMSLDVHKALQESRPLHAADCTADGSDLGNKPKAAQISFPRRKNKTIAFSPTPVSGECGSELLNTHCVARNGTQRVEGGVAVPSSFTINVDEGDLNPLKPCGACNEWLKKIAEVNPRMKVITFTDANCNGIYIEDVDE